MSEYIVETFGIVQEFADLHGDMNTPLYEAIMNVMLSRQREPIVRCCDCRHYAADELGEFCGLFEFEMIDSNMAGGFCAWGERRSE